MNKANPVVHFEMPYEDRDRMAEFYGKAFGWETNKLGQEMGNYVVAMTSESDKNGPLEKGRINGGFFKRSKPDQGISVVISVDDIQAAMKKVEESGGKIIGASQGMRPDNIPGVGLYIAIEDTEGNKVALLEPVDMSGERK